MCIPQTSEVTKSSEVLDGLSIYGPFEKLDGGRYYNAMIGESQYLAALALLRKCAPLFEQPTAVPHDSIDVPSELRSLASAIEKIGPILQRNGSFVHTIHVGPLQFWAIVDALKNYADFVEGVRRPAVQAAE